MENLKYIYFAAYALVYTLYGCSVTAIGPIIVYFTKVTQHDQSYFSFIFFAKAIGFVIGGYIIKAFSNNISQHRLFVIIIILCGSSLIVSSLDFGFWNLSLTIMIIGGTFCMMSVLCNACLFQIFFQDKPQYWLQLINIFYGIGGLIGPLIVIYTEELGFRALGIMIFICIAPIAMLDSPEHQRTKELAQDKNKELELPRTAQVCICALFFLYIALEVAYSGWIPTYVLKAGVANATTASGLSSLFWIINTVARLFFMYLPGTVASRLSIMLILQVGSMFIVMVLQWIGQFSIVAYAGVISSGIFLSSLYPLFFSMVQQYGYGLNTSNTVNFVTWASLGQGLLVMPIGYAMGLFGYQSLIYIIFLLSLLIFGIYWYVDSFLQQDSKGKKEQEEIND